MMHAAGSSTGWRIKGLMPAALACFLVLTGLAYLPGLHGSFVFDDYSNIVSNRALLIDEITPANLFEAVMSGTSGPLKRPLTMATFAVNHALTGITPYWFKLTNLAIHLLNGVLVYMVSRRLLDLRGRVDGVAGKSNGYVALVATALWLAHPAQLTSVLYVVQRMTSLSATFVLGGLVFYLRAREAMLNGRSDRRTLWFGVPACTVLAILAKENGALLPLFAFAIEATLLRFQCKARAGWSGLNTFYFFTVVLPLVSCAVFLAMNPQWVDKPREFSVMERMLTETRVLWMYAKILVAPASPDLALYYDDFAISRSLFQPLTTAFSLAGILAAAGAAVVLRTRWPWFAFAVCWFLAAHSLESSFIMLELVHAHRNYLAYLGPILAASAAVAMAFAPRRRLVPVVAAVAAVGLSLLVTAQRSMQWSDPIQQVVWEVRHRPESPRANYELARAYYLVNLDQPAESTKAVAAKHFQRAAALDRHGISALVGLLILDSKPLGEIGASALIDLTHRLARHPLAPRDVTYLKSIVTCLGNGNCEIPPPDMLKLFGAILGNGGIADSVEANVLAVVGMYYANQLGDMPACIRVMREAVKLQPRDVDHRLNLVHALMMQRDYPAAKSELEIADRLDRLGAHRRRVNEYRNDLTQLMIPRNSLTAR